VFQQSCGLLGGTEVVGPQEKNILQLGIRIRDGGGLSQREWMVSMSNAGSLDTAQCNFVGDRVKQIAAKVELMFLNHACCESA
jgi:hypothetical protein